MPDEEGGREKEGVSVRAAGAAVKERGGGARGSGGVEEPEVLPPPVRASRALKGKPTSRPARQQQQA
jgi:hypothetical protein